MFKLLLLTSYFCIFLLISIFFSFLLLSETSDHFPPRHLADATSNDRKRLFLCNTGIQGLGDQLERYFYCLYIAKLLHIHESDLIIHGFSNVQTTAGHHGVSEYPLIAAFLGIDLHKTLEILKDLKHITVTSSEAETLHERLRNKSVDLPCSVYYSSDIMSCGKWCFAYNNFKGKEYIRGFLQRKGIVAKSNCVQKGYHNFDEDVIQIVWHVRQGDICLHCTTSYQTKLYQQLLPSLKKRNIPWNITFESQGDLSFIKNDPVLNKSYFIDKSTLVSTICRFLTSNILITSGSSLPTVIAAYSELWNPIIIEEHRKEGGSLHYFSPDEAVLVEEGNMLISEQEFYQILMINTKYMNEY